MWLIYTDDLFSNYKYVNPGDSVVKNALANERNTGDVGWKDLLEDLPWKDPPVEEEMATHSTTLAWKIP